MKKFLIALSLLAGCCCWAPAASIFSFDQATYTVMAGNTVSIPVYLQLDDVGTNDLSNMIADDGMFSIGVRLVQDTMAPMQPTMPAGIATLGDIQPNMTEFDANPTIDYVSTANAGVIVYTPIAAPDGPQKTSGQPTGRFLIGNFVFTTGTVVGETTIFNAQDIFASPSADTVTFNGGFTLDPTGIAPVSITTVAPLTPVGVPAPAAAWAGLVLLAAMGFMQFVRWRRM